jgi:ATP-dependent Lhr-like helicase
MRGEIRGGRFVAGVAGEQFALPEAVDQLREQRDEPAEPAWHVLSAVDPLNLVGILNTDARVPATRGNRLVFRNGRPVAALESKSVRWLAELDEPARQHAAQLLRGPDALRRNQIAASENQLEPTSARWPTGRRPVTPAPLIEWPALG